MDENTIVFAVACRSPKFHTANFELLEYDTVEHLKIEIHNTFEVPPHRQVIEGWKNVPEDDQTILQVCSDLNRINYLTVHCLDVEIVDGNDEEASTEIASEKSCMRKNCKHILSSRVKFNLTTLKDAVDSWALVPAERRKVILLYMHTSGFEDKFFEKLQNEEISEILNNSFYVLGWDIENESYHSSLNQALADINKEHLSALVHTKTSGVVLLQNINGILKDYSFLVDHAPVDGENGLLICLKNCRDFLTVDCRLSNRVDSSPNSNDIDSMRFQKLMADMLGDRDYDSFAFDQHEFLRKKIGYALFGQPRDESGYSVGEKKEITKIFDVILKHSSKFTEYKGQVEISFIYNTTEPLPKEKAARAKKNPNYNPNTDITPVPIFVLRKCLNTENDACRMFIDDTGRKYESWAGYLKDNKLPECMMVLPKDGRYKVEDNQVLLETHKSPQCSPIKTVLKGGDIASTVGGVGSGGFLLAAGIVSIPVAPVALIAAGTVGAAAGIYSMVRSGFHLADRVKHDENLSLANSEARGIYFNILAGSMGFVGAGANMAVSQLAANGFNIGKGVGAVVNTIGVANIGVSGASIINSGYDVFDQWYNKNQTPTLLTIVQLSSSILFFGNAVYNFKPCQTIVEESQGKFLQEYQDSLRSNRHRKTFDKLMRETVRQNDGNQVQGRAEVIKTIRNIPNKDEVFASLTRNGRLMNRNGIRFSASGGDITFNGQTVNMNEFGALNKQQASAFLSNLPTETNISASDTRILIRDFRLSMPNVEVFARYALRLITTFGTDVRGMLLQIVDDVIRAALRYFADLLDEIFPNNTMSCRIINLVMEYFGGRAADYLQNYNRWRGTGSPYYYQPDYVDVPVDDTQRYIWIFEKVVRLCFSEGKLMEYELKDILKYLEGWMFTKYYERQINEEADQKMVDHSPVRPPLVTCSICCGQYFKN